MKNWSKFAFFVVAVLWGACFAFQKPLLEVINPYTFTFWNFFIPGVIFLLVALFRGQKLTYRLREGFILGALLATMELFQMVGLKYATAADAAFISNLGMLLIPYAGWMIFRHKISALHNVAIICAIVGLYFLVGGVSGVGLGELSLLVCAGIMALYFLYSQRFEGEKNSHMVVLLVQQFFTVSLVCSGVVLFFGETFAVEPAYRSNFLLQIIVFTTFPYLLIHWASRYADEMTAALYDGVVEPLVGGIVAWGIFLEPTTRMSVTGALIMVLAFAFGSIFTNRHFLRKGLSMFHSWVR